MTRSAPTPGGSAGSEPLSPLAARRALAPPARREMRTASLRPAPAVPLLVPQGGSFEGLLTFRGEARIEGRLRGRVRARGRLVIGTTARVDALVDVDELVIEGDLRGDVSARDRVEIAPTATFVGAIDAPRVRIHDGCRFRGRCRSGAAQRADASAG